MAPMASPKKEMSKPFQNPKNKILAAVIKKLGRMPESAMSMLISRLIKIAYCWHCSKS